MNELELVYHPPVKPGECGELRTPAVMVPGIGIVDELICKVHPHGSQEAVARLLVKAAKNHDKLTKFLAYAAKASTLTAVKSEASKVVVE